MAIQQRFGLPPIRSTGAKLAVALVGCSLLWALMLRLGVNLYLVPDEVLHRFHLWQLITFIPVELPVPGAAMSVLFGALILWSIGGALEQAWGTRQLLYFAGGIPLIAGVITTLMAWAITGLQPIPYGGASVVTGSLWVAYGLHIGRGPANFWGIPLTGNMLAMVGVLFVVLNAAFSGWAGLVPDAIGLAITFLYVKVGSPRFLWLRVNSWRLQRQLRTRSNHLRVVGEDRNHPSGSDRYLH
jgi:hypothetical protein